MLPMFTFLKHYHPSSIIYMLFVIRQIQKLVFGGILGVNLGVSEHKNNVTI